MTEACSAVNISLHCITVAKENRSQEANYGQQVGGAAELPLKVTEKSSEQSTHITVINGERQDASEQVDEKKAVCYNKLQELSIYQQ